MLRYLLARNFKPGGRPGELGADSTAPARIPLQIYRMDWGAGAVEESSFGEVDKALSQPLREGGLTWLHFQGDIAPSGLRAVRERFKLHPLAVEDVLNHGQRPKAEPYDEQVFGVLALPRQNDEELCFEQFSVFVGTGYLLSFHAGGEDIFAPIRKRIREPKGRIARAEPDYLAYALMDVVVDYAFPLLEVYADRLETIEDTILDERNRDTVSKIHACRHDLIAMRKVMRQQTKAVTDWVRLEHPLLLEENVPYFRDVEDHAQRVGDLVDGYRDTTSSLLDTYLSLSSARLNDVMKMLTLIATIFMPLSFLAGIYGMNFNTDSPWNMPELGFRYGYPILISVMVALVIGMLIYFRRRHWL